METVIVLFACAVAAVNGQILNPIPALGTGPGWNNPMWHSGMRYPGLMQTSQLSSMTYPTWRSHPLFRMVPAVSEKNVGSNVPSDVINIAKVPSTQEVLTHMALANPNPKAYFDTIGDFLYEPQKARTVFASVTPVASLNPIPSVTSPLYMQGMNLMRAAPNAGDDCVMQEGTRLERGMDWLY